MQPLRLLILSLVIGAIAAACSSTPPPPARPVAPPRERVVASNVLRRDYAGSQACAACHAKLFEKWRDSPMRRMTRLAAASAQPTGASRAGAPQAGAPAPAEAAIRAPFDGSVFRFKGDTVTVLEREGRKYMRVVSEAAGERLYRVTKVIGGRYREDFVGREVAGTEADSAFTRDAGDEPVLPISFVFASKSWRYKGYSVMVKERPRLGKHGAPWRQTCIFCHNTAPYLATIYDDLLGGEGSYQGAVSDRLLPEDRRWSAAIADEAGLRRALADEMGHLGGAAPDPRRGVAELVGDAMDRTRDRFDESHLVEVGIGCEACHNGAREHAEDPTILPSFAPRSALLSLRTPNPKRKGEGAPSKAEWINRACARCHTVLFSRYPYTWEGGTRRRDPGGSSINSGEARDFLLGGCTSQMSCATCHDPHAEDAQSKLDELGTVAGNHVCTSCHEAYRDAAALAAHSHHAPTGEGSACLSCHMPRKNTGLGYRLTRYHRIGSPTDARRVERDRPLECALCHADRSVSSLVASMERWWGKRYDRAALEKLYGDDPAVNPLVATVAKGRAHERIAAAAVLGLRGPRASAPLLVPLLSDDYPLVRYFARQAIEDLLHGALPVDLDGDLASIQREGRAWVDEALATPP